MHFDKVKSIPELKLVYTMDDEINLFTFYRKGAFTYVRCDHSPFSGQVITSYYRARYSDSLEFVDYKKDNYGVEFMF